MNGNVCEGERPRKSKGRKKEITENVLAGGTPEKTKRGKATRRRPVQKSSGGIKKKGKEKRKRTHQEKPLPEC